MAATDTITVIDQDGLQGTIDAEQLQSDIAAVSVRLPYGQSVLIPLRMLIRRNNGTYYFPHKLSNFQQTHNEATRVHTAEDIHQVVLPVVEEEVNVGKKWVETGRVRVSKVVRQEEQTVDENLLKEEVDVRRIPVNRVLDAPEAPRQEGDTLIIPVMEEMLVIEKRLVLKEEIHVTKRQQEVPATQTVTVRKEEAIVERLETDRE